MDRYGLFGDNSPTDISVSTDESNYIWLGLEGDIGDITIDLRVDEAKKIAKWLLKAVKIKENKK